MCCVPSSIDTQLGEVEAEVEDVLLAFLIAVFLVFFLMEKHPFRPYSIFVVSGGVPDARCKAVIRALTLNFIVGHMV